MLKLLIFVCLLVATSAAAEESVQRSPKMVFQSTMTEPLSPSDLKRPINFNGHLYQGQPISKETRNGDFMDMHTVHDTPEESFGQTILRNSKSDNRITSFINPAQGSKRVNPQSEQRSIKIAEGYRKEGIQIGPPGAVLRRGINSFSHRSSRQIDVADDDKNIPQTQSQIFLRNSLDRKEDARMARTSDVLLEGLHRQEQLDDQSSGTGKERPLRQVNGGFSGFPGSFSPIGNLGTSSFGAGIGDPFRGSIGNFGATNLGTGFVDPFRGNVGNFGAFGGGFGDQFRGNVGNFGFGFGDHLRGNVGNFGATSLRGNIGAGLGAPFSGNVGNFGTLPLGAGLGTPLSGNVGNLGASVGTGFVDPIRGNVGNLGAFSLGTGGVDPLRGNVGNLGLSTLGSGIFDPIRGNVGNLGGIPSLGAGLGGLQSFGGLHATPFGTTLGGFADPFRTNVGLSPGILGLGTGSFNGISQAGIVNPLLGNIGGSALLNRPLVSDVGGLPIGGLPGGLLGRGPIIDPLIGRLPIGDRLGLSLRGRDDSRGLIIDNFGRLTFGDRPGPSDILDQTPLGPVIEEKPLTKDSNYDRTTTTSGRGSSFQRTGSFVLRR